MKTLEIWLCSNSLATNNEIVVHPSFHSIAQMVNNKAKNHWRINKHITVSFIRVSFTLYDAGWMALWTEVNSKFMLKHAFIDKINIFSMIANEIKKHMFFDRQVLERIVEVSFWRVDFSFNKVIEDRRIRTIVLEKEVESALAIRISPWMLFSFSISDFFVPFLGSLPKRKIVFTRTFWVFSRSPSKRL